MSCAFDRKDAVCPAHIRELQRTKGPCAHIGVGASNYKSNCVCITVSDRWIGFLSPISAWLAMFAYVSVFLSRSLKVV